MRTEPHFGTRYRLTTSVPNRTPVRKQGIAALVEVARLEDSFNGRELGSAAASRRVDLYGEPGDDGDIYINIMTGSSAGKPSEEQLQEAPHPLEFDLTPYLYQ